MATDAVRLAIGGNDLWLPSGVFLFGFDNEQGGPNSIIPLVHMDNWGIVPLSTDPNEGNAQVRLPLIQPGTAAPNLDLHP